MKSRGAARLLFVAFRLCCDAKPGVGKHEQPFLADGLWKS